jgi:hypothetical protein
MPPQGLTRHSCTHINTQGEAAQIRCAFVCVCVCVCVPHALYITCVCVCVCVCVRVCVCVCSSCIRYHVCVCVCVCVCVPHALYITCVCVCVRSLSRSLALQSICQSLNHTCLQLIVVDSMLVFLRKAPGGTQGPRTFQSAPNEASIFD